MNGGQFPKNFVFGAATAAYQIEGGRGEDGKGDSIWDTFCDIPGHVDRNENGNVACDHYHRMREDVALMREMHLESYRFSVAWTRLLPNGVGEVNPAGIAFYNDLINELLQAGIKPMLTLYHWDLPQALQERGGWLNPDSVQWFTQYAQTVFRAFGDRVKDFITFNEPFVHRFRLCDGIVPAGDTQRLPQQTAGGAPSFVGARRGGASVPRRRARRTHRHNARLCV